MQKLDTLLPPVRFHHLWQTVDNDVEKAPNQQAKNKRNAHIKSGQSTKGIEQVHFFQFWLLDRQATGNDLPRVLDHLAHFEDWQIHGDDQTADDHAQHRHNHWFHQARQRIHCIVDFSLKEVRHFAQHAIK